jgi:hypothetical protein
MAIDNAPHDSAYWCKKAEEARARADEMHYPEAVQSMLQVAQIYDVMAKDAAAREGRMQRA